MQPVSSLGDNGDKISLTSCSYTWLDVKKREHENGWKTH
jgi:hypothetical protein